MNLSNHVKLKLVLEIGARTSEILVHEGKVSIWPHVKSRKIKKKKKNRIKPTDMVDRYLSTKFDVNPFEGVPQKKKKKKRVLTDGDERVRRDSNSSCSCTCQS